MLAELIKNFDIHEDFKQKLIYAITKKAKTEDETCAYTLHHEKHGLFNDVDLNNYVFVADNHYQLWLSVNNFMYEKSRLPAKIIVRYGFPTKRNSEPYDMANYNEEDIDWFIENLSDEILEEREQLILDAKMTESEIDDFTQEKVFDEIADCVVNDFFTNDYFWAKQVTLNDDMLEEEESANESEDEEIPKMLNKHLLGDLYIM